MPAAAQNNPAPLALTLHLMVDTLPLDADVEVTLAAPDTMRGATLRVCALRRPLALRADAPWVSCADLEDAAAEANAARHEAKYAAACIEQAIRDAAAVELDVQLDDGSDPYAEDAWDDHWHTPGGFRL